MCMRISSQSKSFRILDCKIKIKSRKIVLKTQSKEHKRQMLNRIFKISFKKKYILTHKLDCTEDEVQY